MADKMFQDMFQVMCREISNCIDAKLKKVKYDKSFKARILYYDNQKQAYIVSLNNSKAVVKNGSNNIRYTNGSFVWITAPCGDMNNLYISGEAKIY